MNGDGSYDIVSLLSSSDRDFLIRRNNDQVKIESLKGKKKLGLCFPGSWPHYFNKFTSFLVEFYNEVASKGDFEIVFISDEGDHDEFNDCFARMPWLAIPFSDGETRARLNKLFKATGHPRLVILSEDGEILSESGKDIVLDYGAECYPFTAERIKELKEEEERARREQSLRSLLVFHSHDYVISSSGAHVPISELEGKTVALYFAHSGRDSCVYFTPILRDVYEKLKAKGEKFEIVSILFDDYKADSWGSMGRMPWLALPFNDVRSMKLQRYFTPSDVPALVIIGPDGKTLHSNAVEAIEEHGIEAFPFIPAEIAELDKAKEESQTLESLFRHKKTLVVHKRDYVIDNGGNEIPVCDLEGKNILLYFGDPPCDGFLPRLIEVYHKIKAKDDAFEVIFITPGNCTLGYFDVYFHQAMPWLGLPVQDDRNTSLRRKFKIKYDDLPVLVALGPTGRTVAKNARELIERYGAEAYPFTDERVRELEHRGANRKRSQKRGLI